MKEAELLVELSAGLLAELSVELSTGLLAEPTGRRHHQAAEEAEAGLAEHRHRRPAERCRRPVAAEAELAECRRPRHTDAPGAGDG